MPVKSNLITRKDDTPQPEINLGRRIVLIGPATDGPLLTPVDVGNSKDRATQVFGNAKKSKLTRAIHQALTASFERAPITAIRVGSMSNTPGKSVIDNGSDNVITLTTAEASNSYKQFAIDVTAIDGTTDKLSIFNPKTGETTNFTLAMNADVPSEDKINTVRELIEAISTTPNTQFLNYSVNTDTMVIETDVADGDGNLTLNSNAADLTVKGLIVGDIMSGSNYKGVSFSTSIPETNIPVESVKDAYVIVPKLITVPAGTKEFMIPEMFATPHDAYKPVLAGDSTAKTTLSELGLAGGDTSTDGQFLDPADGTPTELTMATSLDTLGTSETDYFTAGNKITFGDVTAAEYQMLIAVRIDANNSFEIKNALTSQFELTIPSDQDGNSYFDVIILPDGTPIDGVASIGLNYTYSYVLDNTVTITESPIVVRQDLPVYEKDEDLKKALKIVQELDFSLVVPVDMYIDEVKESFNPNTGALENTLPDYLVTLRDFLKNYYGIASAFVAPTPITGSAYNNAVTKEDMETRINEMLTYDVSKPLTVSAAIKDHYDTFSLLVPGSYNDYYQGELMVTSYTAALAGHVSILSKDDTIYRDTINGIDPAQNREYYSMNGNLTEDSEVEKLIAARMNPIVMEDNGMRISGNRLLSDPELDFLWFSSIWVAELIEQVGNQIIKAYLGKKSSVVLTESIKRNLDQSFDEISKYYKSLTFQLTVPASTKLVKSIDLDIQYIPFDEINEGNINLSKTV